MSLGQQQRRNHANTTWNAASADAALAAAATRPSTGRQAVVSLAGLVAAIAVLALTFGGARPANAAFPGGNGKIAFASYRDGNYELYVMNADGSGQTRLTQTDEIGRAHV